MPIITPSMLEQKVELSMAELLFIRIQLLRSNKQPEEWAEAVKLLNQKINESRRG